MKPLIELSGSQINSVKWNELIQTSENGLIYHSINFLNSMAPGWSALILGDYEYALPLMHKKKIGYHFLQQPPFIQQLGLIGNKIHHDIISIFLNSLDKSYDYIHYSLNFDNPHPVLHKKKNFIIPLNESYDEISNKFSSDAKSNIKKSYRYSFSYVENKNFQKTIIQFKRSYGERFRHIKSKNYENLIAYCNNYNENCISREVYLKDQLCASALLLKDKRRLYFLINIITSTGRNTEANYYLIDQLIREFSGSQMILDLEGSDLAGVAEFYQKFGAIDQPYYQLISNKLPFFLQLFKK